MLSHDTLSYIFEFTADEYVFHGLVSKDWLNTYKNIKNNKKTSVNNCISVSKIYEYIMSTNHNRCFSINYFSFILGYNIRSCNYKEFPIKESSLLWIMHPYTNIPERDHVLQVAEGFSSHNSDYTEQYIIHILSMYKTYIDDDIVEKLVSLYMKNKKYIYEEYDLLLKLSHRGSSSLFDKCILRYGGYSKIDLRHVICNSSWMEGSIEIIKLCVKNGVHLKQDHFIIGIDTNNIYLMEKCTKMFSHEKLFTVNALSIAMSNGYHLVSKYICDNCEKHNINILLGDYVKRLVALKYPRCFEIYNGYRNHLVQY